MAKVTSKGQITIPVSIRRRLNISEGDKLLFIDSPEGVIMVNPDMLHGEREREMVSSEVGSCKPEVADGATHDASPLSGSSTGVAPPEIVTTTNVTPQQEPGTASDEAAAYVSATNTTSTDDTADSADTATSAATLAKGAEPADEPKKPASRSYGLDLGSLLDDIRSIGSKI